MKIEGYNIDCDPKPKIKKINKIDDGHEIIGETPYSYKIRFDYGGGAVEFEIYKFKEIAEAFAAKMELDYFKDEMERFIKMYQS